jgi:hypothetical protein
VSYYVFFKQIINCAVVIYFSVPLSTPISLQALFSVDSVFASWKEPESDLGKNVNLLPIMTLIDNCRSISIKNKICMKVGQACQLLVLLQL